MGRGRPKGSKNKSTIASRKEEIQKSSTDNLNIEDTEHLKILRILKKCQRSALDKHSINYSERSENILKEVMTLFYKELEDNFNIKLKQIRKR